MYRYERSRAVGRGTSFPDVIVGVVDFSLMVFVGTFSRKW
jgi:hypothetical protein